MKTVAIELSRGDLRAVAKCAGKDDIRYYLNGVQIEIGRDAARLCATDGHRLALVNVETKTDVAKTLRVILPIAEVNAIKRAKRHEPEAIVLTIELEKRDDEKQYASIFDGASTRTFPLVDGTFPDYQRVIPRSLDGTVAQFNPDYIADFKAAAVEMGHRMPLVTVSHNGDSPALVTIGNPRYLGVVMPLRADKPCESAPEWAYAELTPKAEAATQAPETEAANESERAPELAEAA